MVFIDYDGLILKGKVGELRSQLVTLLPDTQDGEGEVPEYETQDDYFEEEGGVDVESSEETTASVYLELEEMKVGEVIEIY